MVRLRGLRRQRAVRLPPGRRRHPRARRGRGGAVFAGVAAFTIVSNACKLGADTALVRFVSRDLELTGGA
ncbi:hypothetical protein LUW77_29305 [Streptomyces radiopugnans]|nr:hypothetical protein LUW77_29305 [Streptomyces radiopugnans]